jgi:plasmid stability protein
MSTLTIRNLPEHVVAHIKEAARAQGHSMEQEVRETLARRYADRDVVLQRLRQRWPALPETDADALRQWRKADRP